jgi:Ca2+-binding RTX toxin-like protein
VVSELPLRSDRFELTVGGGTPLLTSTSLMSTPVDLVAPVGYVPVHVGGTITICPTGGYDPNCTKTGTPGPLVTVSTTTSNNQPATLPLSKVFATTHDNADSIVSGTESARAHGQLVFDVRNDPGFFGASSGSAEIGATVTTGATPTVTGADLAKLKVLDIKPGQDDALFGVLLADLDALNTQLHAPVTANGFDTTIPLLGTSLGTLMAGTERRANPQTMYTAVHKVANDPQSPTIFLKLTDTAASFGAGDIGRPVTVGSDQFVIAKLGDNANEVLLVAPPATIPAKGTPYLLGDGLQQSVAVFTAAPPEDLNELLTDLKTHLGNNSSVTFAVDPAAKVMTLTVDWKRSYNTQTQLAMHLGKLDADLAGTPSGGVVSISFTGEDKAVLQIPLDASAIDNPAANLTIDRAASYRRGEVKADRDGDGYTASVGAFGITIGDSPDPKNTSLHADIAATGRHGPSGTEPLAAWGAGLAPGDVGHGATAVTCSGVSSTTAMALCASLPLHWSGGTDTLKVRLPLTAATYAAAVDPSTQLDGTDRTSNLPNLAAALAAAKFNPAPLGDGLVSFLDNTKQGLNTATAGGKVPLIGKDLQAGQDFLGGLRGGLANAFGTVNTTPATFGDVKAGISGAISSAGGNLLQGSPMVTGQCKIPISPPSGTVATPTDPKDQNEATATYQYAVIGEVTGGGETQAALSSIVSNRSTLGKDPNTNTTATNLVTWSPAQPSVHVSTYKVWRKVNGAGNWIFVAEVGGTSLTDSGQGGSPTAASVGNPAGATYTGPCADTDASQYVQNVTVAASFGKGVISANDGCATANDADPDNKKCYQPNLPLDLGLPGLSLRARRDTDGVHQDITARLGWSLGIKVTLDKNKGVLLETTGSPTRLQVGAAISIPSQIEANLSFLHVSLKNDTPDTPVMHALFEVDLKCPGSCSNGQVPLTQLAGNPTAALDPKVSGGFNIDEAVKTDVDPSLPGLSARFKFAADWAAGGGTPLSFGIGTLEIDSITVDPGTFLGSTVYPMVRDIANTLKPIEPILDTITAPIPVLTDLSHLAGGGDVTIVSLAEAFGSAEGVQEVVDTVKKITELADALSGGGSGTGFVLGSIKLNSDRVSSTSASPDVADSFIGQVSGAFNPGGNGDPGSIVGTLSGAMNDTSANLDSPGFTFPAFENPRQLLDLFVGGDATLATADTGTLSLGFEMSEAFGPVYAPPPVMVVISGGASVSLRVKAGFDTFGIRQAVEDGQPAQILNSLFFFTTDDNGAPLPVVTFHGELAAGAEVSVAFLSAGVEGGISLTVVFTWADPDNDGKFRFNEFLAAAVQNPICLFNVGGELSLFIKVFITIGFSPFDVSFDFTLIDIKLLDFSIKPNCTPPPPKLGGVTSDNVLYLFAGKLGDDPRGDSLWFAHNNTDETWVIHQQDDGSYAVKALGYQQVFPNTVQAIVLDAAGYQGKLNVLFQGHQDAQKQDVPFGAKVYVIGGDSDDTIKTADSRTVIDGRGGADTISTGDRPHPETGAIDPNRSVQVAGDGGNDHITVGNEKDTVAGDGGLKWSTRSGFDVTSFGVDHTKDSKPLPFNPDEQATLHISTQVLDPTKTVDWDSFTTPSAGSAGNDVIQVGFGGDTVYGGGGDDAISVSQDSPLLGTPQGAGKDAQLSDPGTTIYGNDGSDSINGGTGPDTIYTGDVPPATTDPTEDNPGSGDTQSSKGHNTVDTGTGNDTVYGSSAPDLVIGHSLPAGNGKPAQHDTIYGLGGNDVLVGGDGGDQIYGGRGNDLIAAQPSQVDLATTVPDQLPQATWATAYAVTPLADTNPALDKTLVGGGGTDRIYGGDGNSHIWGDHSTFKDGTANKDDPCASPGPDQSDPPAEHPRNSQNDSDASNYDAADLIRGGNGADTIQAGGGDDWVFANSGTNQVCGEGGADHIYGGDAVDIVWGGTDGDVIQGNAADDRLYGNDGPDFIYGNLGADLIEGNGDSDTLFGGEDADKIIGGTTTAQRPDSGDTIYGDTGSDTLIGDNGDPADATNGPAYDLGNLNTTYGGKDTIYGGDDEDRVYGGLQRDTIYGGANNDHLEGNNDADTIYGQDGADDIIGGSSQLPGHNPTAKDAVGYSDDADTIDGGAGDDVITGDNATILDTSTVDTGDPVMKGRSPALTVGRHVTPYDLGYTPAAGNAGGDTITGGPDSDITYGQAGIDTIHGNDGEDYLEGGPGGDNLFGDAGQDDIVGGSLYAETGTGQSTTGQLDNGDRISGGDDADVVLGDNGLVTRDPTITPSDLTRGRTDSDQLPGMPMVLRSIQRYDLGDTPVSNTSGADLVNGDNGADVILGQAGNDLIEGDNDADYAEGGPGRDWIEGNAGDDDLVGGSSAIFGSDTGNTTQGQPDTGDVVYGGPGDDLITGDNAVTDRVGTPSPYLFRVGGAGTIETQRSLRLLDLSWSNAFLGNPTRAVAGGDQLSGGGGVDVIFGQDGDDQISGGGGDDYVEGNGGHDTIYGDRTLADAGIGITHPVPDWPGPATDTTGDTAAPNGQDDLIGGSSLQAFRDTGDDIHGDAASDYEIGDNGTEVRDILDASGKPVTPATDLSTLMLPLTDRIYTGRYDPAHIPADAAYVRHGTSPTSPTRFCTTNQATCEPTGAWGDDKMWGDEGTDFMYGQDGADRMYGETGSTAGAYDDGVDDGTQLDDDDMYGELGNDIMFGEAGQDAMVGDRGGVVGKFQDGTNDLVLDFNQVPQIHYEGFVKGSVTRVTDLLHDVNGDTFIGTGNTAPMPHRGDLEGGNDRMRGGVGDDSIHGGFGDDLANGDSGGDTVFGDDGADVLWGGKGCDAAVDTAALSPDCYTNGVFDPNARGARDRMVDYIIGGKGATSGASVDPNTGDLGSDILDWHPRGTYGTPGSTTCTANPWPQTFGNGKTVTTIDPCSWFEMTSLDDADIGNNQHHQGIDWMYGGWDRDVTQADVADNGPNPGDRLIDWSGAYNLYTHCNAAYGGYNDLRQWSPDMQSFLQQWAYSLGAGQQGDVTTGGTSAFDELALVYQSDLSAHGSGSAYPSTPGHFDNPNACAP